jgi:hypothetical protein
MEHADAERRHRNHKPLLWHQSEGYPRLLRAEHLQRSPQLRASAGQVYLPTLAFHRDDDTQ